MKKTAYHVLNVALTLLLVHGSLFISSCTDELDTEQNGVISTSSFYQTDTDCEEAIIETYSAIRSACQDYNGSYWNLKTLLSDEIYTGGSTRSDGPAMQALNEYQYDYSNAEINEVFSTLYGIVYRANLVINNFDPDQSDVMKRNVAEAKVFRAWAYFELVTLWGTPPLVLEAVRDDYKAANTPTEEIWAQIEEDLTDAINSDALVQKTSIDDATTGIRVTKQFAQAMLGKAYVFQEEWTSAISVLQQVVSSGLYGFLDDYGNYCVAAYNNNREILFSDSNTNDASTGPGFYPWVYIGPNPTYISGLETGGSGNDYSSVGFGMWNPSQAIVDAFLENEPESPRFTQTLNSYYTMMDMGMSVVDGQEVYACCGYFNWKYRNSVQSRVTNMYYYFWNNNIIMKYSEVVLLLAEALIQSQGAGAGDTYINLIRDKAGVDQLSGATLDDLKLEKQLELYMDGCRYQDLVRWGDATTVLAEQGKQIPNLLGVNDDGTLNVDDARYTNSSYGFKEKHKLLPFPQEEMEVNPNITQNSGW